MIAAKSTNPAVHMFLSMKGTETPIISILGTAYVVLTGGQLQGPAMSRSFRLPLSDHFSDSLEFHIILVVGILIRGRSLCTFRFEQATISRREIGKEGTSNDGNWTL